MTWRNTDEVQQFLDRLAALDDDLAAAGHERAGGFLWFAMAALLMGDDMPTLMFLQISTLILKLEPMYLAWKEEKNARIRRDPNPDPENVLDSAIERITEWPEALE